MSFARNVCRVVPRVSVPRQLNNYWASVLFTRMVVTAMSIQV